MEEKILTDILELSGRKIVGRIRIQKTFFLLKALGIEMDIDFEYHHYGPYSEDLASLLYWSEADGSISEEFAYRAGDGARYSVFNLETENSSPTEVGGVSSTDVRKYLRRFDQESATVLELAATAVWLKFNETCENWEPELRDRKAEKITADRLARAKKLITDCGLAL